MSEIVDTILAIFLKLQQKIIDLQQARLELSILLDEYRKELDALVEIK